MSLTLSVLSTARRNLFSQRASILESASSNWFSPFSSVQTTSSSWFDTFVSHWSLSSRLTAFHLMENDDGIWNMSSTLKKRKAKMNKHKLRKRRKSERLKNKK
uniref:Ribosomal protein mS38 C-terminal domain-containing protein n=1 Tax=Eucampia antarctica TaxID=49252 RepID=A0A7S2WE00_9STRA|mmetsp:Transcript_27722/g.26541  ORF Transcript_27722/g.26541 Transcript_27722/m.26541 type:complete len:103 (+) Transcript_27722:71-379(+)